MWFWQHKKLDRLWLYTTLVSGIGHILLFGFLFFYKDKAAHLSFALMAGVPRLRPLEVTIDVWRQATSVSGAQKASIAKVAKVTPVAKKPMQKQTTIASKEPKNDVKKKAQHRGAQKKTAKKVEAAKPELVKKKEPEIAKPVHKEEVIEKKKEEKVAEATPAVVPPVMQVAQDVSEKLDFNQEQAALGKHELALLEEFYQFQETLVGHWCPPRGFALSCACELTMIIDWEGKLQDCGVTKSSGVLVYDTAAQDALCHVELPRWTWGKTITIAFNQ